MKDYKEKNYVNMYPLPAKGRGRDYVKVHEMYDDIKKNPANFYAQPFLNDRSCYLNEDNRKRLTSNWIAEQLLYDMLLDDIDKVESPDTYLIKEHIKPVPENTTGKVNREEEKVAHRLFEREDYSNSDIDFFADYQVPICRDSAKKKDKATNYGKIDLVSVSEAKKEIYLMELKTYSSEETLLRCVCECYTYWKQIDHNKLANEIALKYSKPEYAFYKVVPTVLVFDGQYQHLQLRSGYLHSLQELMVKYGVRFFVIASDEEFKFETYREYLNKCIIKELPVQIIDFPALAKRKSQELAIALDDAICHAEHKADNNIYGGYTIADKFYSTYLSNKTFDKFLAEMKPEIKAMFKDGDGGELEIRCDKDGKAVYPPKMACFGSSSRMMYNAAKHLSNFIFEKKMPTTVGGTANLDGYYNSPECHIFVEAKCREPYGEKSNIISRKYEELYKHISDSPKTNITCDIGSVQDEKKMKVIFKYDDKIISYFDIKQLISHYLGIATAILKEEKNEQDVKYFYKPIKFLYFIYDPRELYFEYPLLGERIKEIYGITCDECESINHQGLFEVILEYLKDNYYTDSPINTNIIVDDFRLSICSQNNFIDKLEYEV